jgi:hypothetical protein
MVQRVTRQVSLQLIQRQFHQNLFQELNTQRYSLLDLTITHWNCVNIHHINLINGVWMGRDSSDGIATCYELDGPGIDSRWERASYTMGTWSFLGVKWPGRGVDHPPHLAPRLRKEYSYISGPSWPVLGWTLPLTFTLTGSEVFLGEGVQKPLLEPLISLIDWHPPLSLYFNRRIMNSNPR